MDPTGRLHRGAGDLRERRGQQDAAGGREEQQGWARGARHGEARVADLGGGLLLLGGQRGHGVVVVAVEEELCVVD